MKKTELIPSTLLAVALAACTPSAQQRVEAPALANTGVPALHAIDSNELRNVMRRINNLMHERNLTSQEMDSQQRLATTQVIDAAKGLDESIDGIIAVMPSLKLAPGEDTAFRSLAVKLRDDAYKLKFQAETHQLELIPATLERMSSTCNSCHALYRDFSKPGGQK